MGISRFEHSTIVVADDHALVRQSIIEFLKRPPLKASCIEADCFQSCSAAISKLDSEPDLILVDMWMPPVPGLSAIANIIRLASPAPVLAMSGVVTEVDVESVMEAGASGFLSKDMSQSDLLTAVELVLSGGRFVSPAPSVYKTANFGEPLTKELLTPRQFDVASLISKGLTNKEIGRVLNISPATVKIHVASILKSTGVQNRTELTRLMLEEIRPQYSSPDYGK